MSDGMPPQAPSGACAKNAGAGDDSPLNPGVARREVWAWAMYDFANSGYTTVILTAVFSTYFVGVVGGRAPWATLAWTAALSLSYLLIMLTMPSLGARADARAGKRRLLYASTVGCVAATLMLTQAGPGDVWLALAAITGTQVTVPTIGSASLQGDARFAVDVLRPMGRATSGVYGMRFNGDDSLLSMNVVKEDQFLLVATSGGYAKRTAMEDYPVQGRGGKGVLTIQYDRRRGHLVGAEVVAIDDEIFAITSNGGIIRTAAKEVRKAGRQTKGVRLMNLAEGDSLLAIARNADQDTIDEEN